jgi:Zn-dependent protease
MEDTVTLVLLLVPCLVIAIVFHEVAHGYMAKLLGDPTAGERGRLTLNPIRHVDPVGTLLVPGAMLLAGFLSGGPAPVFGWAKPVPVNQYRLRNPRYGMMAVALAGPASNFVLAALGAVLIGVLSAANGASILVEGNVLGTVLTLFILINIFLGLFNLLPIPPFDGSHIVGGLLPDRLRFYWAKLQQVGIFLLVGVIAYSWFFGTAWLETLLLPPLEIAMGLFLHLADIVSGL